MADHRAAGPTAPTSWNRPVSSSGPAGGEFAFGCVYGAFADGAGINAVQFDRDGSDETGEVCGDAWAELKRR
jgi:hypothetical protein